jgi:hypothetical protein
MPAGMIFSQLLRQFLLTKNFLFVSRPETFIFHHIYTETPGACTKAFVDDVPSPHAVVGLVMMRGA